MSAGTDGSGRADGLIKGAQDEYDQVDNAANLAITNAKDTLSKITSAWSDVLAEVPGHQTSQRVVIYESCAVLTLIFGKEGGHEAKLSEIRLEPPGIGQFEPWHLTSRIPFLIQRARAELAANQGDPFSAIRALRQVTWTKRGFPDSFLRLVASAYGVLVADGEPHPVKALAKSQPVDVSTASRWLKAARARGFLA